MLKFLRPPASRLLPAFALAVSALSAAGQLAHEGPAKAIALAASLPPYDVVSVKRSDAGDTFYSMNLHEDRFRAVNVPLMQIIEFAYDIKSDLIFGLSGPITDLHFDIEAKVLPSDPRPSPKLADMQLQAMIIPLLADRFHLKAHLEEKTLPVYNLVVARGGPKFQLSQDERHGSGWDIHGENTEKVLTGKTNSMADLADQLSDTVNRKVIDKTGLTGHTTITLKWSDDVAAEQGGANVVSIFTAIEEQLGLKLQPSKGPVDTLVIDHAEMPSQN